MIFRQQVRWGTVIWLQDRRAVQCLAVGSEDTGYSILIRILITCTSCQKSKYTVLWCVYSTYSSPLSQDGYNRHSISRKVACEKWAENFLKNAWTARKSS
jgi:hypothetical protein